MTKKNDLTLNKDEPETGNTGITGIGMPKTTLVKKPPVEVERKPLDFEPHTAHVLTDKVEYATISGTEVHVNFANEADADHFFTKLKENMSEEE